MLQKGVLKYHHSSLSEGNQAYGVQVSCFFLFLERFFFFALIGYMKSQNKV